MIYVILPKSKSIKRQSTVSPCCGIWKLSAKNGKTQPFVIFGVRKICHKGVEAVYNVESDVQKSGKVMTGWIATADISRSTNLQSTHNFRIEFRFNKSWNLFNWQIVILGLLNDNLICFIAHRAYFKFPFLSQDTPL